MNVSIETIRALKLGGSLQDDETVSRILDEHSQAICKEIDRQQHMLKNVERMKEYLNQSEGVAMEPRVLKKESFTIVGSRWSNQQLKDGFGIPKHWEQFMSRAHEILGKVNANEYYGIGMPQESGEFVYIAGFESKSEEIPQGMIAINIPEMQTPPLSYPFS